MTSDFSTRHVTKWSNRSFPWGIVLICILFLSFLLWSKWDKISQFFGAASSIGASTTTWFVIGDQITLEWDLRNDGDFITHTHTLLTQSSGVFGLKSKTVNLNLYTGHISLEGTVDSQQSGLVIIQVTSVMDLNPITTGQVITGVVDTWVITTWTVTTGQTVTPTPVVTTWTTQTPAVTTTATPSINKKPLTVQEWVQQVPVTIGTGIVFTSSRGHSILFPSKRISFQSISLAATDFGVKGLRCYSQINVVAYANKANLTTAPSVKIYECTNKNGTLPPQFASVTLDDGRIFLIEATDPSWWTFANAIEITAIPTTN